MITAKELGGWCQDEFKKIRAEFPDAVLADRDLGLQWWIGIQWKDGADTRRSAIMLARAWVDGRIERVSAEDVLAEARRQIAG